MKNQFTNGPWNASGTARTHDGGSAKQWPCFYGKIMGADGQSIITSGSFLGVTGKTVGEAGANARLIASSPVMLEALKEASTCASIPDYVMELIREAIKLAEGK